MKEKAPEKKFDDVKLTELEDQLKRAVADYRNLEKRVVDEKKEFIRFANRDLLLKLLPAFDTLFIAEKFVEDQGLKLSIKQLTQALIDEGVERIETEGKDFDANFMECVEIVEGEDNKVMQEVAPGFTYFGKLLRPARVKVGRLQQKVEEKDEDGLKKEDNL